MPPLYFVMGITIYGWYVTIEIVKLPLRWGLVQQGIVPDFYTGSMNQGSEFIQYKSR